MNSLTDDFEKAKKLHVNGHIQKANLLYRKIVEKKKDNYIVFSLLGTTYLQLKNYNEAINNFNISIKLNPNFADNYNNRGASYAEIKNYELALKDYEKSIYLNKNYFDAHLNKAVALTDLQRYEEAKIFFEKSIKLNPNVPEIYNNLGHFYVKLNKYNSALKAYDKAISLKTNFAVAYNNRGDINYQLRKYHHALNDYLNAFKFNSNLEYVFGKIFFIKMCINKWDNFLIDLKKLEIGIKNNKKIINPFHLLSISDDPLLQKLAAIQFSNLKCSKTKELKYNKKKTEKIKLGYFSGDFRNHAVSHLMIDVFKNHDKSKFEVYAFHFSPYKDEMTEYISKHFNKFFDCSKLSDKEVVNLSQKYKIDIAIDLSGYTKGERNSLYQYDLAPFKINYLGYPGTMGSDCYDFIIADEIILPEKEKQNFSEKVIYLPECYQPKRNKLNKIKENISKKEVGLPENTFVFGCLNNNNKITPQIFKSWMEILNKTKRTVLWLLVDEDIAKENIKKEAKKNGVNFNRIFFANRTSYTEHLKRFLYIDLFLDTHPYSAHTTAKEAISMGIPVITKMGNSFASRVASSILTDIGLKELITTNIKEYTDLAIELQKNQNKLEKFKNYLNKKNIVEKIHDHKKFTKDLENIFIKLLKPVYS